MSTSARAAGATGLNPYQVLVTVSILIGALLTLNRISIWFAPVVFCGCIVGLILVLYGGRSRSAGPPQEGAVDYARLAAIQMDKTLLWLKQNLRGHDRVVDAIVLSIARNLQLARPGRTLGNFLLVGPTGTGKTFLAQLISASLFPESEPTLLSMNEYKQPGDTYTLIGPPPGMPGHEVGGRLTRPILENPYRVVILDELEKAHRDMHDCLYNILDTASCREKSSGRHVDFSACVFFATCNAGVEMLRSVAERPEASSAWLGRSRDALAESAGFDRAFLSRWDGVYLMDRLPPIHVAEVACLQLARYWREYGIDVEYAAPELILDAVQHNADFEEYGVRQLGRYIREKTEPAILEARRQGVSRVRLAVEAAAGALAIEVAP